MFLVAYPFKAALYGGRVYLGEDPRTYVFFRFLKEVPVIFLCAILLLAYLRPEL